MIARFCFIVIDKQRDRRITFTQHPFILCIVRPRQIWKYKSSIYYYTNFFAPFRWVFVCMCSDATIWWMPLQCTLPHHITKVCCWRGARESEMRCACSVYLYLYWAQYGRISFFHSVLAGWRVVKVIYTCVSVCAWQHIFHSLVALTLTHSIHSVSGCLFVRMFVYIHIVLARDTLFTD